MPAELVFPEFAAGSVWLVGAGPGDPGLLTLTARHALEVADVVLHDALVPREILWLAGPRARLIAVGKRGGKESPKQLEISQRLVALARAGLRVVRLKGGDPFVFGRGGEEALALSAAGIPFRVVPGVTAGTGAATYAGVPLTHRLLSRSVAFVTGKETGGDGHPVDWQGLATTADTIVVYMGRQRLDEIVSALLLAGRPPQEPVLLVGDGTLPTQRRIRTTLDHAVRDCGGLPGSAATLVVIGGAVLLGDIIAQWQESSPARVQAVPLAQTLH